MANKAEVVVLTPEKVAEVVIHLVTGIPQSEWKKTEETVQGVNGIAAARMLDQNTLELKVARAHVGKNKTPAVAESVLRALGLKRQGDITYQEIDR